ncbi:hypothetical protein OGH69_10945 [Flavobacterium sp. MFBS3-15]|uniref:hypothetical protein n=1 Tax=Flavobacterium sp. MFBS3-15 TaxID=2989816 RepID=UPI002235FB44|nr:hypothetical protein [Flavobacterium sp. MFBS3-15]MCW4469484.1 hypothetical protein [Flavobacterium sp. MFBS3-15]
MTRILPALICLLVFGYSQKTTAQQNKKEQIAKYLTDYFFLERENIHVHLNKNVFMTNEQVWFKGYVFHRKKNIPFFSTVNIYASLIDSEGKILETQLVYGNIGSFSGSFKLGNQFKSGKYYLQFYTNWMNNFLEDESSVYEIAVINENQGAGTALAKADPSKINIILKPEGGILVSGIQNTIGISITNCNNGLLPVSVADITDTSGKPVMKVQINKKGYGKFVLPANATGYKAVVSVDGIKHEQALPLPSPTGIALDVNNMPDKTLIKLRTNAATAGALAGRPVFITVHQDDNATIYEIVFKDGTTEQSIVIPTSELFEGLNTIRILDSELKQMAERLIYKYPTQGISASLTLSKNSTDNLEFTGNAGYPNMSLSISALPENTMSLDESNDIYSSLRLMPYIKGHKGASGRYYFENISKIKMYELDLYLMNQGSKYDWNIIKTNPPGSSFSFDMGLALKGTVPKSAGDTKSSNVRLYSLTSGIDEMTEVDDKRDFHFNNIIISDSSYVNFTLVKKGQKPKELTLAPQILNGNKMYNKPFRPDPKYYLSDEGQNRAAIPGFYGETTVLKEVTIEASSLKYAKNLGNSNLRAYKISDTQAAMYQNLLNYIKTFGGFNVSDNNGQIRITTRTVNTINGAASGPIFYIDNMQQMDYSLMSMIQMSEVDEIYMSPHAIVPSVRNYIGVIKVYLKKGAKGVARNTTPDIIIKNGFSKVEPFENVRYVSTSDAGFENFGVIGWEPLLMADEKGSFSFSVAKTGIKEMKVIIEGFSADGKLISETKTIPAH